MPVAILILSFALADEAADALKQFEAAYKSKDAAARAQAVTELAKTDHEKVIAKLEKLLVVDAKEVRLAAAAGLGIVRETAPHNKKEMAALTKGIVPNYAERSVLLAIVEALEKFGEGVGLSILHQHFASPDIPVAKAAVETAGDLRRKESIPALITFLKYLETTARDAANVGPGGRTVTGGGLPGIGGAGGQAGDPDAPKRARALTPVVTKTLESLTRKTFKTTAEWEAWWKKEGDAFKVEK
ncbi:MAG TPA: HEAT repeat domain-containing protein [Planctomycetota bacterium]|nr:HEAT repeat domain-containing protein [Planctomycetota bacterium]